MVIKKEGSWEITGILKDYAMGHDPKCPYPYGTWILNSYGLESGNYFKTEEEAIKDLIERAGYGS